MIAECRVTRPPFPRQSLNDKLAHRPEPEKLVKEGVLHEDPRSPEERYAEAIEDEYAKREGGA